MPSTLTPERTVEAPEHSTPSTAIITAMDWAVAGIDIRLSAGYGYRRSLETAAKKFHLDEHEVEDEYLRRKIAGE